MSSTDAPTRIAMMPRTCSRSRTGLQQMCVQTLEIVLDIIGHNCMTTKICASCLYQSKSAAGYMSNVIYNLSVEKTESWPLG